jgi:acyl carrier protein
MAQVTSAASQLKQLLGSTLGLGKATRAWTRDTPLLGVLPELDSMAIATVLTHMEEEFHILIHDDEISAENFETFGSLLDYVETKLKASQAQAQSA